MKPNIQFKKFWSDDDMVELAITVCDGHSSFQNTVYVGNHYFRETVDELDGFRLRVHGGIYDLKLGAFGPEYGNGAFSARFHFHSGKLYVSTHQESEFFEFSKNKVASKARLYLRAEPAALDNFIKSWKTLSRSSAQEAVLDCLSV